jgi:hypothetical protein
MKAALSFASAACLPAALSQPVQAQADWQANPNCAPIMSYSSAAAGPSPFYAGSQVRTVYPTCNPASACAVAPTCALPAPMFRSLVINKMIFVPETVKKRRTVQEQQVRTWQVNTIADSASGFRNETSPRPANAERGLC